MATVEIVSTTGTVSWRASRTAEETWIAECVPLGICLEGDTLDEILSLITEAIDALLRALIEDNELEQFLNDRGWQDESIDIATVPVGDDVALAFPGELVVQGASRDFERSPH